jgi:hypothetical protein
VNSSDEVPSPDQDAVHGEGSVPEVPPEQWQALEAIWRTIMGLEVSIDSLRLAVDGLRLEMETAFKKTLPVEDKLHALQSDVVQWTKAKSRVHYALPKAREFIHRAIWAAGLAERQRLEGVVKNHIEPRIPLPDMDQLRRDLEHLQKDRQVLFGQGSSVQQECRGFLAEIQRCLAALQRNAADNARRKRSASREKGKHF